MDDLRQKIKEIINRGALDGHDVMVWGTGRHTEEIVACLNAEGYVPVAILDNFRSEMYPQFAKVPVYKPEKDHIQEFHSPVVLYYISLRFAEAVKRQIALLPFHESFDLNDATKGIGRGSSSYEGGYHFSDRSRGAEALCYVIAGYEDRAIAANVIERIHAFGCRDGSCKLDVCIVSSGKYSEWLASVAEKNQWSYLWTDVNQVCRIQNIVIRLHPAAKFLFKFDEDVFIGSNYFRNMLDAYRQLEAGPYRIGFLVPVIPVNSYGYLTFLELTGNTQRYAESFGRPYYNRYSTDFEGSDVTEFLWSLTGNISEMASRFDRMNKAPQLFHCYFNIGAFMYPRSTWEIFGGWPENPGSTGMADDENFILEGCHDLDFASYEIRNTFAAHLAFKDKKREMRQYFYEHPEVFQI